MAIRERRVRQALLTALLCLLLAGVSKAMAASGPAEPDAPPQPFLRIEAGEHSGNINRLAVDAAGALVATASDDKTIRLWAADDGRAVATLRIPMGSGEEGALYAVALAPDGKALVATGATGVAAGAPVLYLFDVEQQRMRGRLPLPGVAFDLAYSPDGRFFAAGFDGKAGIRVWDARSGKLVVEDRAYGDRVTKVTFDHTGRLATASFDGKVRLYDTNFKRVAERSAGAGAGNARRPFSVAFSPDGELLAVGYADLPRVEVLSGRDLSPRSAPRTADLKAGNLAAVAWMSGGSGLPVLAAAGTAAAPDGRMVLRLWREAGMGAPDDVPLARDSINALIPLPGGGLLVAAADPAWGRLDERGRSLYWHRGALADFRDLADGRFALSADGLSVEFGVAKGGREPFRFDVLSRRLTANPPPDAALARPVTAVKGLAPGNWRNHTDPALGKRALPLSPEERARSLAVAADGRRFLLGTDFFLRLYDAAGTEVRRVATPAAAWGVALAPQQPVAVAALGDGTLRWYSLRPGEELTELLAVFPHPDGRRWVAWTPAAFFDHSDSGGKELVGFHLNQGRNKAPLWVDFSQVYRLYFAPELVAGAVSGRGAAAAAARLDGIGDVRARLEQRPLPKVELTAYCLPGLGSRGLVRGDRSADQCRSIDLTQATRGMERVAPDSSPASPGPLQAAAPSGGGVPGDKGAPVSFQARLPPGTTAVKLLFRVVDQGGGVGPVDLFLNERNMGREMIQNGGRAVGGTAPSGAPGLLEERIVHLDAGNNRLMVRAYESSGAVFYRSPIMDLIAPAAPESATGGPVPAAAAVPNPPAGPVLHVLAVGINAYAGIGIPPLGLARPDARSFVEAVEKGASGLYHSVRITELYDAQATLPAVLQALEQMGATVRNEDTVLIYLSGHGYADDILPYHFITVDVPNAEPQTLQARALTQEKLVQRLAAISARNSFLFLDTCHAGAVPNLAAVNRSAGDLGHETGRYILAASASDQEARDSYDGRNGLLAYALVAGLGGQARTATGVVDSVTLGFFARDTVNRLNDELNDRQGITHRQRALFKVQSDDLRAFPLARVQ